jgi:hypothetical protein
MFSIGNLLSWFKHLQSPDPITPAVKKKFTERLNRYLHETVAFHDKVQLHFLKVILSLKKFNSISNYKSLNDFMWRQFSYNVG